MEDGARGSLRTRHALENKWSWKGAGLKRGPPSELGGLAAWPTRRELCRAPKPLQMSLAFTTWNIEDGAVDAMLRGRRATFLTDVEYTNLKEGGRRGADRVKEDFEDLRLTLQETDYGNFLQNEVSCGG